jgi:hypothetical protein
MEVDSTRVWAAPRDGGQGHSPSDGPLGAALGVAETIAKRHGGEVRLRSCGDGSVLVELRFSIPARPA